MWTTLVCGLYRTPGFHVMRPLVGQRRKHHNHHHLLFLLLLLLLLLLKRIVPYHQWCIALHRLLQSPTVMADTSHEHLRALWRLMRCGSLEVEVPSTAGSPSLLPMRTFSCVHRAERCGRVAVRWAEGRRLSRAINKQGDSTVHETYLHTYVHL